MKQWILKFVLFLLVGLLFVNQQAWAASPMQSSSSKSTISYQGYLVGADGNPVNAAALAMIFRLYNVENGGAALWQESKNVAVSNGLFSVLLGATTPIPTALLADNNDLWLGITIGSDTEMAPREKIASAPYALLANVPDGSITGAKIVSGAITAEKIADNAVTTAKIQDGEVRTADIQSLAVTSDKLAADAVTTAKIKDGEVGTTDVQNLAITSAKLAADAVTTAKIKDGEVTSSDVGFNYAASSSKGGAATDLACSNCVSTGEIVDGVVTGADIENNTVTTSDIADGTVTSADLASSSVTSIKIADGQVTTNDVSDGAITQVKFSGIRMYMTERQVPVDANGEGCVTIGLPSGRFTTTPHVFVTRSSIGPWEDHPDHARTRFIEMQRSTSSIGICLDDDTVSNGSVGIAVLVVQSD